MKDATGSASHAGEGHAGEDMVDWNLAVSTAHRLLRPGPDVTHEEATEVVAELRAGAAEAEHHVREYTGMRAGPGSETPVLVVDRPGWVTANVAGFRTVMRPLTEKLASRRSSIPGAGVLAQIGGKVTGLEMGALLAFLSSRVLGQYETFAPAADGSPQAGRLLLVAPNVVHVERELDVDPKDFRLWVCLHEETHRTQFTAVDWLRDHLESEVHTFLAETEVDPAALLGRIREAFGALSGQEPEQRPSTLLEVVQSPVQREVLSRITAVMSLLEGHADYVMDGVGPAVVPSVAEIREKFSKRRKDGAGRLDQALRRLLGLDAKLRQYAEGEKFVRGVVERVGMDGFNRVWTSPNTLPTQAEIADPESWVSRVVG